MMRRQIWFYIFIFGFTFTLQLSAQTPPTLPPTAPLPPPIPPPAAVSASNQPPAAVTVPPTQPAVGNPTMGGSSPYAQFINTANENYVYDPGTKRDPFQPYGRLKQLGKSANANPLILLDVNQYKLIGILWDISRPQAIIKDPQGKLQYYLKRKDRLGNRNGYVLDIREGEVLIVEPNLDGAYTEDNIKYLRMSKTGSTDIEVSED